MGNKEEKGGIIMAKIDIDKFVASVMDSTSGLTQHVCHCDLLNALKAQGLEYKNGEIIKTQRRVAAEAKEAIFDDEDEDERIRKAIINSVNYVDVSDALVATQQFFVDVSKGDMIAWLEKQGKPNKEYHRVPSTTLKRLYMNEAKYELLKSDIMEGIVGDFEKGTTHSYLTIKIPMLLCPSNCTKGDKVKLIIVRDE